uniref:Uncharacterized protein n=1 Tax=Arundo donax TaxID=35708 RepID=A0A0A9CR15_ARUDO
MLQHASLAIFFYPLIRRYQCAFSSSSSCLSYLTRQFPSGRPGPWISSSSHHLHQLKEVPPSPCSSFSSSHHHRHRLLESPPCPWTSSSSSWASHSDPLQLPPPQVRPVVQPLPPHVSSSLKPLLTSLVSLRGELNLLLHCKSWQG